MNEVIAASTNRDPVTATIIGAALEVHRALGPGLLESVYELAMRHELLLRGIPFRAQASLPVRYKGVDLGAELRMDLVVDNSVVVEIKSVERILPVHSAQLLTYLRLTGMHTGLLLNFNVAVLRNGIVRRVL
jgi:GxxExxY protein